METAATQSPVSSQMVLAIFMAQQLMVAAVAR